MSPEAAGVSPRILVVDDQAGIRLSLRGILMRRGFVVDVAEDGASALEMARKTAYRLILMDIKMPGLSGVQAFIQIKAFSPGTTVIMMTAFAMEEEIRLAIREGAYTVVYKPFDMEKMLEIIGESLNGKTLILIVDDESDSAVAMKEIFQQRGYRVGVVESGEQCLAEVVKRRYEIILLDVKLPGIDGVETLRRVKEVRPDVGVITMTAYAKEEVLKQAMLQGSFACIRKPFEVDDVVKLIEQSLKKTSGTAPSDG